jgi:hypothetical protein
MLWRKRETNGFDHARRKGDTNEHLGDADTAVTRGHQAIVAGQREDAAAGDGVTVHRHDQRLRKCEQLEQHARQRGDESIRVFTSTIDEPKEIDAR